MKGKKRIYMAYGSNLNLGQMAFRCPGARPLGTARLRGWRLLFRGAEGNAFATIEEHAGSSVPVLLWETGELDEKRLDRYEGWPVHYFKQGIGVTLDGKEITAMAYVMTEGKPLNLPGMNYLRTIKQGYRDCGFPDAALRQAVRASGEERDGQHNT
jgi:hypothetical protein